MQTNKLLLRVRLAIVFFIVDGMPAARQRDKGEKRKKTFAWQISRRA